MIRILSVFLTLLLSTQLGWGQPVNQEVIIPQTVRAATLEERPMSQVLYFQDIDLNYRPFSIGQMSRGGANVQPMSKQLVLNQETKDEMGMVVYKPVMSITIPEVNDVLVLFYWDESGSNISYLALDDSADSHPSKRARVVNLTNGIAQFQLSNNPRALRVTQNQEAITDNPVVTDSKYFNFAYALSNEPISQSRPPVRRWRMSNENQRLLVVLTYGMRVEEINGELIETRMPQIVTMFDLPPKSSGV